MCSEDRNLFKCYLDFQFSDQGQKWQSVQKIENILTKLKLYPCG
jgi:hypothetical protein